MTSGHGGFPSPLTGGGDPPAPPKESGVLRTGNVAQGLEALSPTRGLAVKLAFQSRVARAPGYPSQTGRSRVGAPSRRSEEAVGNRLSALSEAHASSCADC